MSAHKCDPSTNPGGGLITTARALRVLIEMLKAGTGVPANPLGVVQAETAGCPDCSAKLFFGIAASAIGTLQWAHGPNALMMLELQLAGVEADIEDADGDQ
ncbi:hypothetical protein [Mycolicibacterium lutetiense]